MASASLIKNRNFAALWIGQVISEFGDRLAQMALIAGVYFNQDKGHVFRLAVLLTFTVIPVFFVGPVAGAYIDRWNRKKTMLVSDILRGTLVIFIPFFLIYTKNLIPVYLIVFVMFSITRFFLPAKLGIIPDIVPKEKLLMANSLTTTTGLIAAVLGLGFGGIVVEMAGIRASFYIDALSFFISALAIALIKLPKPIAQIKESIALQSRRITKIEKNIFKDIKNSFNYIVTQKELPAILKTFFILMSGIGAIYVVFIDFILKNLVKSPEVVQKLERIMGFGQFGLVIVFLGLGAFMGTVIFGRIGQSIKRQTAISLGFMLSGVFLTLFSYATQIFKNFWITGTLALFLGFSAAPIIAIANTMLHEVTQEKMRGRVFSTLEIVIHIAFLVFMFLSMFLVTTLKIEPVHILGIAGILALIYGLRGWVKQKSI